MRTNIYGLTHFHCLGPCHIVYMPHAVHIGVIKKKPMGPGYSYPEYYILIPYSACALHLFQCDLPKPIFA